MVPPDDVASLRLVNKAFNDLATPHLFHTIYVDWLSTHLERL